MDDDGRSGRGMAGGNMGKLTHLEAFCSEYGKSGRVWTDGCSNYKRHYDQLWMDAHKDGAWKFHDEQVAAMDDDVTWADEPKTLTPHVEFSLSYAEALVALHSGSTITSELSPEEAVRIRGAMIESRTLNNSASQWSYCAAVALNAEETIASWRIVDGGK